MTCGSVFLSPQTTCCGRYRHWKKLSTGYRGPLHTFPETLRAIANLYHYARSCEAR